MDEFGIETDILWLPDVFGYSAALPQILKKAGVDYFMTIKISWSQFNKFPYSSFWWEGIDGSRVLAHFPPSNDYNARINANQLLPAAENYREKDRSDIALYSYGYGDGGGGPTREHLEHLKRAKDLEGLPKCTPMWAADFFKQLVKRSEDLPLWVGELYLEYHRGTYTTQSRNKRANRKSELLLRDAEMAAGLAWMTKGLKYPHEQITRAWKLVCKNQFHDVIPGTSVTDVYKDTALDYKEIAGIGAAARTAGLDKLAGKVSDGQTIMLFNSLSWDRHDAAKVALPGKASGWHVETQDGQPIPSQASKKDPSVLWFEPQVPGIGIGSLKLVKGSALPSAAGGLGGVPIKVSESGIENSFYKIKLDKSGLITSILDKRSKREILPQGMKANVLQLFEDKPISWDAWDIEFYYRDKGRDITELAEITVEDAGPVRGSIKIRRKFGSSEIEQRIVLWGSSPRIDFETRVDWHETKKMLKVAFPVDVHASSARFDIQFGSRPTMVSAS
jgi:alpha-mannosidase